MADRFWTKRFEKGQSLLLETWLDGADHRDRSWNIWSKLGENEKYAETSPARDRPRSFSRARKPYHGDRGNRGRTGSGPSRPVYSGD